LLSGTRPKRRYAHLPAALLCSFGAVQLCTGNGISIYMCSAVEVALLAQNIRHSSTRV